MDLETCVRRKNRPAKRVTLPVSEPVSGFGGCKRDVYCTLRYPRYRRRPKYLILWWNSVPSQVRFEKANGLRSGHRGLVAVGLSAMVPTCCRNVGSILNVHNSATRRGGLSGSAKYLYLDLMASET